MLRKTTLLGIFLILALTTSAQMIPTFDDIMIEMRDNEFLEADVFLPSGPGPFEVILIQTPYNKDNFSWSLPMGVQQNVDGQPFAFVIVDWRGFYGSSGAALGSATRGEDAYDICDWIVAQSWHGDRIGTWGPSALGKVQYNLMAESHPNHVCAVPLVASPVFAYSDFFYGGVLEESHLETLDALGYGLSPIIMANVYYNTTWQFSEASTWTPSTVGIPTLQIGGWYDHNISTMLDWYKATRNSAQFAVRNKQWLLVGPWVHGGTGAAYVGSSLQGELNYPNAEYVSDTMAWEFLNFYLLDAPNNWENTAKITYYELGDDSWQTSMNDNIDVIGTNSIYLNEGGSLINVPGANATSFISDPSTPSPTLGGPTLHINLNQGPYDQISLEGRADVKTFSTDYISQDVTTTGHVTLDLFIEADQPDCDVAVRLVDEYPDGRNMLINDGIRRMRFRNGYTQADEVFMTSGQVYPVQIELPYTNYTWKAGHKIKIYVSGNNSIRWNVNLQDGGTMYQAGAGNVANITVHHNNTYPSKINLPGNNPILGINYIEATNGIDIYPNPTKDLVLINAQSEFDKIELFDSKGSLLMMMDYKNEIDLSPYQSGIYFMKLSSKDKVSINKIIKE